jgi:glycosyltransferase involved in cell wall biosynthesis
VAWPIDNAFFHRCLLRNQETFRVILLSHPFGNQNVRHAALALARAGFLHEFWTCIRWKEGGLLDRSLPSGVRRELRRRSFPAELDPFVRTHAWREWGRQIAPRLGVGALAKGEEGIFSAEGTFRSLDRRVARRLASCPGLVAVYGYDDGALETFRAAKAAGIVTIYEHPITHWRKMRRLQEEEADLHPEWRPTLGALQDSAEKIARKDEELALADLILTPSSFSKESLGLAPHLSGAIHVNPYGAPPVSILARPPSDRKKLRVLFVGGMGQAKGLGYLLEATELLTNHIELTLVGRRISPSIPEPAALARWKWFPSLPHDEVLRQMLLNDVLVLPSLHEGFALVLLEAMSQGLPVIASENTGIGDILTDGQEGFLIPIRSSEAIVEKLEVLIRDRELLAEMAVAARRTAAQCSWEGYENRLVSLLEPIVGANRSPER